MGALYELTTSSIHVKKSKRKRTSIMSMNHEADDVGVIDLPQDENLRHGDLHGDLRDSNHGSNYKMPPFPHHRNLPSIDQFLRPKRKIRGRGRERKEKGISQ
ncbi:hypothetical protein F2Q69_00024008 [Brassica cretica]|uniref:Uncharacterized protein n=1 Tax=Brassica cretica TaxID=69181 RepID=A0A8S9QKL6_BRACR|nr:hypothetical protein F2Q69_00024008 [Brassica cretica]